MLTVAEWKLLTIRLLPTDDESSKKNAEEFKENFICPDMSNLYKNDDLFLTTTTYLQGTWTKRVPTMYEGAGSMVMATCL